MIVCWLTLHIFAASPVVKTVFMVVLVPSCEIKDKVPSAVPRTEFGRRRRPIGLLASPAHDAHLSTARISRLAASHAPVSRQHAIVKFYETFRDYQYYQIHQLYSVPS